MKAVYWSASAVAGARHVRLINSLNVFTWFMIIVLIFLVRNIDHREKDYRSLL
jgi:hypothetical protein